MKAITFRPLRRVKKTGKVVVAAYMQWNRIRSADYSEFSLTVDDEYKGLPADEQVYNHEGKPLFWRDFDPVALPIYYAGPDFDLQLEEIQAIYPLGGYGIRWQVDSPINYNHRLLDCAGVPTFSHCAIDSIVDHRKDFAEWEPLTVGVVVKWFGWFLYQLENSHLQIGKPVGGVPPTEGREEGSRG